MKKQKLLPSLLMMGLMMAVSSSTFSVSASSGYGGGSGTQSDPYLISTPEHLNQLRLDVNVNGIDTTGKYYQLVNDIDLLGYDNDSDETNGNFTPIGYLKTTYDYKPFKGTFDGNGKVISNLEIILPEQDYVGLFGYTNTGAIRNLGLENIFVEGNSYVGGIIGYQSNGGTVSQSYATGEVGGSQRVGGLVGSQSNGTIDESYATGEVSGSQRVGGLVGEQVGSSSKISQSYATGNVSGSYYIGGFLGYQISGTINENYSIGGVSGISNVGGLIGYKQSSGKVTNNYWDIETSGQSSSDGGYPIRSVGMTNGIAYHVLGGFDFENTWILCEGEIPQLRWDVDSCQEVQYSNFLLEGDGTEESPYLISSPEDLIELSQLVYHGGLYPSKKYKLDNHIDLSGCDTDEDESNGSFNPIGDSGIPFKGVFDGDGKKISNLTIILPEQNYVGLFGYTSSATIRDLGLENVLVEGNQYVGGLVGYQSYGTITQSYVMGSMNGNQYAGGLVGYQSYGTISESYATGDVSGSQRVGGLVGSQSNGTIDESYATGEVSGSQRVGGLVGEQVGSSSKISQSYATGNVSGSYYIGGLLGYQISGTINENYSIGSVNGISNVGGLIGYKQSSGKVTNNYWDIETSGQSSSDGGTGLTTKQMTKRNAKRNMTGFDFDTVWQESNSYPLLHWQTPVPISGGEEDLMINGNIEATILSLTIPSNSMTFALNPNEENGKQFVASDFELINGSQTPLTLEVKLFEQVTDVLNDVEPTKYSDWTGLNKTQSKDIALALVPKIGDGWLSLNEGKRWVANLGETMIGTIKGNSTVSFGFEAKHGSSFTETLTPQYRLMFVFGLQD